MVPDLAAVLKIEEIGDDFFWHERNDRLPEMQRGVYLRRLGPDTKPSWVARITFDGERLQRVFMKGARDYTHSNGVGSRGIFTYYALHSGIYEVHERLKWRKTRRYFIRVENAQITEVSREEALACLQNAPWA
jgi:hypothetical protein